VNRVGSPFILLVLFFLQELLFLLLLREAWVEQSNVILSSLSSFDAGVCFDVVISVVPVIEKTSHGEHSSKSSDTE
jgi:hypothetical protein